MKKLLSTILLTIAVLLQSCGNKQSREKETKLTATAFAEKINTLPNEQILDVRTADEFTDGHIPNALNYDWYNQDFDKKVSLLDKEKPVLVYCFSGSRSTEATLKLRSLGFKTVYELEGGIMSWRANNLPEN